MRRPYAPALAFGLVAAGFLACSGSNFSGASKNAKSDDAKPGKDAPAKDAPAKDSTGKDAPGKDAGKGGKGGKDTPLGQTSEGDELGSDTDNGGKGGEPLVDNAVPDGGGLLIDDGGIPCIKKLVPLNVVFAIDSTGSMDEEIAAVASSAAQFATSVKSMTIAGTKEKIPSVKVGAISYVDSPGDNRVINLTDPGSFASQIGGLDTRGGINDHCEGGIQAVKAGLDMLASAGEGIPLLIVISDNYSHDGGGSDGNRTFNNSAILSSVKSTQLKNLLFFDSVPTSSGVPSFTPCNVPSGSPADQWTPVREAWKQAHPTAKVSPGKNLGFPFTGSTLLNDVAGEIKKLVKVCD